MHCLALMLLVALQASPQQGPAPGSGLVRSVEIESPPGTWVQYFRLDGERAREGSQPEGLLRYVAGPDPEGGVRVELELEFLAEGVRVIHTEQVARNRRRLVYREFSARGGRTLFLEGDPESGYQGHELGGRRVVRHAPGRGGFPLLLIEAARMGFAPADEAILDPLSARFEPLASTLLGTSEGTADDGAEDEEDGRRVLEGRRADGSLRWRIVLRGTSLVEWRFQERGPLARSISPDEFWRLREQHEQGLRTAREATSAPRRGQASPR